MIQSQSVNSFQQDFECERKLRLTADFILEIVYNRFNVFRVARYKCTNNVITRYESKGLKHAIKYDNLSSIRNVELGDNCAATNDKNIHNVIFV